MYRHYEEERTGSNESVLDFTRATTSDDTLLLGAPQVPDSEEVLIVDNRAGLGPADLVEHKLSSLLQRALLPVSHARMATLCGRRRPCVGG